MKKISDFIDRLFVIHKSFFYGLSCLCLSFFIFVSNVHAEYSLTINVASEINLEVVPGNFAISDTTAQNISVSTNNISGYTLGVSVGSNNDNALKNITNDSFTIPSINESVSMENYADSAYANLHNLNNTWGIRPSKLNSVMNTNFIKAPTTTTILDQTTSPNTSTNTYNLAIGSRVGLTQASGTYANTFIITAIANAAPYSITYNANSGSDMVTNLPATQSGTIHEDNVALSDTVPTRTSYDFVGWCTNNTSETSCSSTLYQPGDNYPISQTTNNTVVLYAIWAPKNYTVTYKSYDGATTYGTQEFIYNTAQALRSYDATSGWATTPTAPSGKSFYGWSTSANSTTKAYSNGESVNNITTAGGNITLYAIWQKASVTYTATTQKNVSSATGSNTTATCTIAAVYNGTAQATSCSITLPANPYTLSGWTFNGWVNAGSSTTTTTTSGTAAGTMSISGNVNIVATWKKTVTITASVTFNKNNGSADKSASNSTTTTLYNGNTTLSSTNISVTSPACTTRTGYTCLGYNTSSTATTSDWNAETTKALAVSGTIAISDTTFTKAFTYYHIWQGNTYSVNYYMGNGSTADGATLIGSSDCTYGKSCTLTGFSALNTTFPCTSGDTSCAWSFAGWSTSASSTDRVYTDNGTIANYNTVGDTNLYAVGVKTFRFFSGIAPSSSSYIPVDQYWNPCNRSTLSSIIIPSATTISGWNFIGYYAASDSVNNATTFAASTVGTSVTPAYNAYTYNRGKYNRTVTANYNANGGSGSTTSTTAIQYYNSGTKSAGFISSPSITLSTNNFTTPTGQVFDGWALGSATGTKYTAGSTYVFNGAVTDSASVTMYATWKPATYTVTYKSYDGTTTYGTQDFVYNAGTTMRAYNATSGWATKPSAPSGKSFYGWATSANSATRAYTNAQAITTQFTSNVTLYAIWSQTLTANFYQVDNTSTAKSVTIYNGTTSGSATTPALNTVSGKTAVGWGASNTATTSAVAGSASLTLTANANYYAIYKYTVTASYNANSGTGTTNNTTGTAYITSKGSTGGYNTTNANVTLATNNFARSGYTFSKWAEGSTSGTQYSAGATRSLASDTTYYAIWKDSDTPYNATISGGDALKSTTQNLTLSCSDNVGVTSYYWGTTSPNTSSTFTSITSTTSFSTTKSDVGAGTYYFACKDATGNMSSVASIELDTYYIYNNLISLTGTSGTYNTNHYTAGTKLTYVAKNGTTIPAASSSATNLWTIPTGASSSTYKGLSASAPSTTTSTVSTSTNKTVSSGSSYSYWFDRNTYVITINVNNSEYATLDHNSITARYGATITTTGSVGATTAKFTVNGTATNSPTTATAIAVPGYTTGFSSWSHNCGNTVTKACTATAGFTRSINEYTIAINPGTGSTITATRTSSPNGNASTGTLSSGSIIYIGDVITITTSATTGYNTPTLTVTGQASNSGNSYTIGASNLNVSSSTSLLTYTVSYSCGTGSGTAPSSQTKTYGQDLTLRTNTCTAPIGSSFSKWKATDGTTYNASGTYTANTATTMTAQYVVNTYTITLDNKSATTAGTTAIYETYGSKYSLTSGGTAMSTSAQPITKPARTYTYTITYNMNSTGIAKPTSPTSVTRTDTFKGYYTAATGGTQYINANGYLTSSASNTNFTANGTLHAQWTNGSATFTLPTIAKTGYTCQWAEGSATGTKYNGGTSRTITASTNYYAVCTANTYTINYYMGNASTTAGATLLGTSTCVQDSACTLTKFADLGGVVPSGWTFYGWNTSTTGYSRSKINGTSLSNGIEVTSYNLGADITLYATFYKYHYFNTGIAPLQRPATSDTGRKTQYWNPYSTTTGLSTITVPTPATIDGWNFVGYLAASNAVTGTVTYTASTVGTAITPVYNAGGTIRSVYKRTVTVNYNANGGSGSTTSATKTQYYNSGYGNSGGTANTGANISSPSFILSTNNFTTPTGQVFDGWALGSATGTKYTAGSTYVFNGAVTDSASVTMYATWKPATYTVTYKSYDGTTTYGTQDFVYNAGTTMRAYNATSGWATKPSAPSGKSFYGWATSANSTTRAYTNAQAITTQLTKNITVYAIWQKASVTYTATTQKNVSSATGSNTTATCTIAAVYNGATQATSCSITLPANPYTLANWTFNGWVNAGSSATTTTTSGTAAAGTMLISGNVNIVATWKRTLTANFYQTDNTNDKKSVTIYNGAASGSVTTPALDSVSGKTAVGWGSSATATTSAVAGSTSLSLTATSKSYYAVYKYTVAASYNGNTNTGGSTTTTTGTAYITSKGSSGGTNITNANITLAANGFTKTGHSFSKWAEGSTSGTQYATGTSRSLSANKTYYAIWTVNTYTITWNPNGGSVSPTSVSKSYGSTLGTLPTPTYAGYNFLGWFTAASGGTQISSSTTVTGEKIYYAHWEVAGPCGSFQKMQNIGTIKNSLQQGGTQIQLCDNRDGKLYWVGKLADGNVWMTQNLDFDLSASPTLSPDTSDVTSQITINVAVPSTNIASDLKPYYIAGGETYIPNGHGYSSTLTSISCAASSASANGNTNCHWHTGDTYSWTAAIASNDSTSFTSDGSNASTSICPKGWSLPTSSNYTNLINTYGANFYTLVGSTSGLYFTGDDKSYGDFWSSTSFGYQMGFYWNYYLIIRQNNINPQQSALRSSFMNIRCVAR